MSQTTIAVWLVCKLCRGSFGQVDAFIEHKKQKHFTEFQKISCIIFEERDQGLLYPAITNNNGGQHLADEYNDPLIKAEVMDDDCINPSSSEIIEEPNLDLSKVKSELITDDSETNPGNENNFGLEQPEQNPYVLLKRLTSEEIQSACAPQRHSTFVTFKQGNLASCSEALNTFNADSISTDHNEVEKSAENEPSATVIVIPTECDPQFECKLCSKQLPSNGQLKIHVGICALYHKHRNRFCVICNRKFRDTHTLKDHRLRFHGTEEEKLSLFKFKCQVCPKKFRKLNDLTFHQEFHGYKKLKTSNDKLKCSHLNCGKAFRCNGDLQRHISTIHLGARPFSCDFPNCNKNFSRRSNLKAHLRIHPG